MCTESGASLERGVCQNALVWERDGPRVLKITGPTGTEIGPSSSPFGAIVECPSRSRCAHAPGPPPGLRHAPGPPLCRNPGPKAKEQAVRERQGHSSQNVCALPAVHPGRRMEVVHGLSETASKQRCCTRLTCRSLTAVCARLTLRARAPMLVAHRRRREKMAPGMCAPMAVRSSPCDPSSCTDLISSQTTFYLSQTRAESLVLTWSIFPVGPLIHDACVEGFLVGMGSRPRESFSTQTIWKCV